MEKILLILESDLMCKALEDSLTDYEVRSCRAGEAGEVLARFQPEALVLDLFLPGTDGFALLESCPDRLPPVILLLSLLDSDYICGKAARFGVDFVIKKPCAVEYILRHLTDMLLIHRFPEFPNNDELTEQLLSRFHIQGKPRLMNAFRQAILICAGDPDCQLMTDVYEVVCRDYGTSPAAIDQAFRRTLRKAWSSRDSRSDDWARFFPGHDRCPSNGAFITTMAAYLRKKYPSRFRKGS